MHYSIFDIETDGLLPTVSKIHCLSYRTYENGTLLDKNTLFSETDIRHYFEEQEVVIGHNLIIYDLPVLEKIYGIKVSKNKVIDTLGLSWYLYVGRKSHGLESWGEELGVKKPKIEDWKNLSCVEYANRCERDVEINELLFLKQIELLKKLYPKHADRQRLINYLNFKMDCLREQEEVKIKIDTDLLYKSLEELTTMYEEKAQILKKVMPKVYKYKEIKKPEKMTKKDGSLSEAGKKWYALLEEQGLDRDYNGVVTVVHSIEEPNPTSTTQIKDWLYSLGWKPDVFNEVKNKKTNTSKEVEQIYNDKKELNESVKELYSVCPELEHLNMFSLIGHRIGIFKSFRDNLDENGFVVSRAGGFSSTLRLLHRAPISNLPKINTFYGEQIRGLLTVPYDNHTFCGSDMSALEDTTKQVYMYKFDPDYVMEMRTPGFDPHISIALFAGLMNEEEVQEFKMLKKKESQTEEEHIRFKYLNSLRNKAKTTNFASVYNVGANTLAKTLKIPKEEAQQLLDAYWEKNKAVKQATEDFKVKVFFKDKTIKIYTVKTLNTLNYIEMRTFLDNVESMWIYNSISRFWYILRTLKDCFSAVNQGSGVFVFDNYLQQVRKYFKIILQYHDEIAFTFNNKLTQEKVLEILKKCITRVNDKLKLPIPFDISADFGVNYAQCH